MKRYHVTTRLGDRTIAFEEPLDDPFVRHTVVLGWRDLLAGLLHRKLPVTVIIGADRVATRAVMSLDLDQADQEVEPSVPAVAGEPACDGFWWIGQPFYSCDNCGRPAWDHAGMHTFDGIAGPFDRTPGRTEPWKPGEADAIRAKWEPRWHRAAAVSPEDGSQ